MTRLFLVFTASAVLLSFTAPSVSAQTKRKTSAAAAKIEPAKRKEIERIMELTGMAKLMDQAMDQTLESLKAQQPEVSEEFWTRFRKGADSNELLELIYPIYDKHYTLEDLKAVNAFYSSPAGKRVLESMPQVMAESMKAGETWGQALGERVGRELEKEKADAADQH